jgi:hypothetical protein
MLAEGKGWKLGYDRNPEDPKGYNALIASDTWSIALTKAEFDDFIKVRPLMPLAAFPCFPKVTVPSVVSSTQPARSL